MRRIRAAPRTLAALAAYEPSGFLQRPLIALHTTRDEVVPFGNTADYAARVASAGARSLLTPKRVARYGHCDFRAPEVLSAFSAPVSGAGTPLVEAASPAR